MGEIAYNIALLLAGMGLALGLYILLANILKLPRMAVTKAVLNVTRQDKKQTKILEVLVFDLSSKLANHIRLEEYKKRKLTSTLRSAGIKLTPETFIARAWVKTGLIATLLIPVMPIIPVLAPVIILLAITVFFRELRLADEILRLKREEIEYELPRFVSTISQALKASRDVTAILISYQKSAGDSFGQELEITIADMKSGNEETALTRLEARIGSTMLSDVVRGLISVKRGDNGAMYFEMLNHDFKQVELQKLKLIAMKQPGKVKKYSFLMLGCFLLMYLGILGYAIINALGKMF
ncbi:MAG: secretion protein F [Clostridiaceae bacterium BRH_c20a]|nr:MAG: secretion protein F [Clostridiaceae bacterium BRH_c20a]